uniref:C3HC-type domain-containing protein n=1 Tax=Rhizophora mucronata TaxID=61149 RepID=A0A2P2KTH8_RHIMU
MAEEHEKMFHSIIDKLFYAPKPSSAASSSSGAQLSRGKKRPNPESALALVEPKTRTDLVEGPQRSLAPAKGPLCRPWDRGDLMRRLATFKSMTWFAKPEVVSAVNCARRGWINVDMDIISCEACRVRLLFSTPSSWTQQQVEKAAMVFSLKLDNGHKLLCPWVNNACDERLAEFPPTSPQVLVDKYRERCFALLQLSALPVISTSALEYMRSPQLEEFLLQSPSLEYVNASQIEMPRNEHEADSANMYYKAQKLIGLCGWEPRSLPYFVDGKDRQKQSVKDADILTSSGFAHGGQNSGIIVHSTPINESIKPNEESVAPCVLQDDPNSVVLDCWLCGASVGLWTFSTVPQPVELVRVIGYSEVNSGKNSGQDFGTENHADKRVVGVNSGSNGTLASFGQPSTLNLTIAGGPPPTKQNFRATISFPVIGRSLRARFSHDLEFKVHTYNNLQENKSASEDKTQLLDKKDQGESNTNEQDSQPGSTGLSKSRTHDEGECSHASSDQPSSLNLESSEEGGLLGRENDVHMSLEGRDVIVQGSFPVTGVQVSSIESPVQSISDVVQDFDQSGAFPENAPNIGSLDSAVGDSQVGGSSVADLCTNGKNSENDSLMMMTSDDSGKGQIQGTDICGRDVCCKIDSREAETCSDILNTIGDQAKCPEGLKDGMQNNEIVAYGTELKQESLENGLKFDPIRQHRHFCPWIVSISGAPGWKQTLGALLHQKHHSHPSHAVSPTLSMIKVDDPITSVRKLFMSPSAKKMNSGNQSS